MEINDVTEKKRITDSEKNTILADIKQLEAMFINFVKDRLGINVTSNCQIDELKKAILNACIKFNCIPAEYLNTIKNSPDNSPLLEYLIASVTVGETYFFRDKQQMDLLRQVILPEMISAKRKQGNLCLRIWSAGCATGEEIYTIAIMLNEMLADIKLWTLHLLATDINTESLKKALVGEYSEWSMRSISSDLKGRYFNKDQQRYEIAENIKELVKFDYLNLNDNSYPSIFNGTNTQDLILCRNVLIYFSPACAHSLMQKLSASLAPDGYLLLGASDPIDIKDAQLVFHQKQGMLFSRAATSASAQMLSSTKQAEAASPKLAAISSHVTAHPKKLAMQATRPAATVSEELINGLLNDSEWLKALDAINSYEFQKTKSAFSLRSKATVLANLGKLAQAEKFCQESLLLDATNKYTYFTYALILMELNRTAEAEQMLRKSIFLDREFVPGYYQLGLLLLKNKKDNLGLKSLRNALQMAKSKDPAQLIQGAHGLSYGRLAEILQYELTLYTEPGILYGNKESADQKK